MESHIIPLFLNRVSKYGNREVFRFRAEDKTYQSLSWLQLHERVETFLSSLQALGVEKDEMVGIFSQNKPQWLMADLAIMARGAVVVPFYATASLDQLRYIVKETGMKVMFAGSEEQLTTARELLDGDTTLEKIVSFDHTLSDDPRIMGFDDFMKLGASQGIKATLKDREAEYDAADLATVIYTSGTTGEPKGVMLRQDNFMYCFRIHDERLKVSSSDVSLCFLPLSHVFERMWSHYLLNQGAVNVFLENPKEVIEELPRIKPTVMCTVPRFFDKTFEGIHTEMGKWSPFKQKVFKWSVKQGMHAIEYRRRNKSLPSGLALSYRIANLLVLKKVRSVFGGNVRFFPCAGAAINTATLKFFHAVGLFVNYGYGATETTATVSCFRDDEYFFGTCGTVMPGIEVKIGENSEILIKGRTVFYGYYKKEKETAEVLKDGWFYSGDEGYLDEQNNLIMVDRIKDLMKTSVGKYVSPQKLEMLLSQDELVEQIIVVGDNRQYVSALVVPVMEKLALLAKTHNISFTKEAELVTNKEIIGLVQSRFNAMQQHITPYERVVKIALLPEPFTIESDTMTSTLKLKRNSIERTYRDLVDKMYRGTV